MDFSTFAILQAIVGVCASVLVHAESKHQTSKSKSPKGL